MKKLLKQNDSKLENLVKAKKDYINEIEVLKKKLKSNERENDSLNIEVTQLKSSLSEITDKYESLRDVDSPIKEVSQMKKLVKKMMKILKY